MIILFFDVLVCPLRSSPNAELVDDLESNLPFKTLVTDVLLPDVENNLDQMSIVLCYVLFFAYIHAW